MKLINNIFTFNINCFNVFNEFILILLVFVLGFVFAHVFIIILIIIFAIIFNIDFFLLLNQRDIKCFVYLILFFLDYLKQFLLLHT
jgi:hypothetical protein